MANTEIGKAYVQIVPSAKGISGSMEKALNPAAASAGKSAGTTVSKNMGAKISSVGKTFIKAGAIATAVSVPIVNGIKDSLAAYEVQRTAETKLTEIYKTRMGVSDKAAKKTMELASALQQQGVIGDEVALSGAQQLATFAKYPGTVNTLLPAMENLLAQQKGVNATGEDAVNIGNLMGKVLMGQTGALKRVGISFDENQEKVLKYGTEQERAAMLAQVITSNVGNMNSELAKTPAGQMAQLNNSLGDIKESIGAALAPVVAQLAQWVSAKLVPAMEKLMKFIQQHPMIGKIAVAVAGILAVGGPLLIMLGTLMTVLPALGGAFSALMGPIGLVVAAVAAAIAIGVLLYKNWDKIKTVAVTVWTAIKDFIVAVWNGIKKAATTVWNAVKSFFTTTLNSIKSVFTTIWNAIKSTVTAVFNGIKTAATTVFNAIGSFFTRILNGWKNIFSGAFKAIADHIISPLKNAIATVKEKFTDLKTSLGDKINAIKETVRSKFQSIKDFMLSPIQKAKDKIKDLVDKIKGFFKFDFHLPHIKLPHFYISPSGWQLGDLLQGSIPSLGIDWYAKGGIVNRPTLLGAGDVRGGEGIVPLDPFWERMDAMKPDYEKLAEAIAYEMQSVTVSGDVTLDGETVGRLVSPSVNRKLYARSILDGRNA